MSNEVSRMNDVPLPQAFNARIENNRVFIDAPFVLCIYDDKFSYQTYRFVSLIQEYILVSNASVTVDLSDLQHFSAAASLLLFAKISKCQMSVNDPSKLDIIFPKDKEVNKLMVGCGLWGSIKPGGIGKIRRLIDTNNQYLTGSKNILENYGKIIMATFLNLHSQGVKFSSPNAILFTKGIQEAVLNVKYHAYDFDPPKNIYEDIGDGRWWQCCWLDKTNRQLIFIIYDDGKGIVNTLRAYFASKKVDVRDKKDHYLIEQAMQTGVTSSGDPERGIGSVDIIKVTKVFPNSHLVVMSGLGHYKQNSEGVVSSELPFEMAGTLVQWVLDYDEETFDENL